MCSGLASFYISNPRTLGSALCPIYLSQLPFSSVIMADARCGNLFWPCCYVNRPEYSGFSHVHVCTFTGMYSILVSLCKLKTILYGYLLVFKSNGQHFLFHLIYYEVDCFKLGCMQLFDRSGMLYGELARFVFRLLGIRTKPQKVQPPGPNGLPGPHNFPGGPNSLEGPKVAPSGAWDGVWGNEPSN